MDTSCFTSRFGRGEEGSAPAMLGRELGPGRAGFCVDFASLCEHHLLPFHGRMYVACVGVGVGASAPTLPAAAGGEVRAAVWRFSHRLQLQERLTQQVAEALMGALGAATAGGGACWWSPQRSTTACAPEASRSRALSQSPSPGSAPRSSTGNSAKSSWPGSRTSPCAKLGTVPRPCCRRPAMTSGTGTGTGTRTDMLKGAGWAGTRLKIETDGFSSIIRSDFTQ